MIATGLTAVRMQEIIDQQIVSGAVDLSGNLVMTREDGTSFNAGAVKGDTGDSAIYPISGFPNGASGTYVRLVTLDGINASNGAHAQFTISGIGDFGSNKRGTVLVHVGQRGADIINVKAWHWGLDEMPANQIRIYTKKLGTYLYEVWAQFGPWTAKPTFTEQSTWQGTRNLDSNTTVAPSPLVEATIVGASVPASDIVAGLIEIATPTEAFAALDNSRAITPSTLGYVTDSRVTRALLDPAYKGPGSAKVIFLPGTSLSTEAYNWVGPYKRWGNRVVEMARRGSTWVIMGHSETESFGGKIGLELGSGVATYNFANGINMYQEPRAQRLSSGIVVLSGLIHLAGTNSAGRVIAKLPLGYRPDNHMLVQVNNGDTAKVAQIRADGDIIVYGTNWVANTYVSLEGLAYPAAGVASWIDIGTGGSSYQNGATAHDVANHGQPGFWKDAYGIVWFRGLVKPGTTVTDSALFNLPVGYSNHRQSHVLTGSGTGSAGGDGFGFVSAFADASNGKIAYKGGSVAGTSGWMSLAKLTVITLEAMSTLAWESYATLNGWVSYGATWPQPQMVRRPDGLAMTQGLLAASTINVAAGNFGDWLAPEKTMILATVGADTFRRIDVFGTRAVGIYVGEFRNSAGSAWQSLDGLKWMVGD